VRRQIAVDAQPRQQFSFTSLDWPARPSRNQTRIATKGLARQAAANSQTTAQFAEQVKIVRQALNEQRRDAATFRIAKRVYIAVDDDAIRARQRIAAALDEQYGYFGMTGL